jgi:hypothetical protein
MKYYKILKEIEEQVEAAYIHLAKLEINGEFDSAEYNEYLKLIVDLTNKEKDIMQKLSMDMVQSMIKQIKRECHNEFAHSSLGLGFTVNAYYERFLNLLYSFMGDDVLDYADTLRYDRNQIILSMMSRMIDSPEYSDIRRDLIFYKYHLLFVNMKSEYDFIVANDIETISLEASSYRTPDFPGYKYVDKAVLVLESTDDLGDITGTDEDFKNSESTQTNLTIKVLNVLASLTLLEEDLLPLLVEDLNNILEDDYTDPSVKEYIHGIMNNLERLKNKISWSK